jgi:hypothetical protein
MGEQQGFPRDVLPIPGRPVSSTVGWSRYANDRGPAHRYHLCGLPGLCVREDADIPAGVRMELDEAAEDNDHLITPEDRYRVTMTRL